MPIPNEVFVPGKFPVELHNVYADRGEPQSRFLTAISRCFVPLVYGSYGVGKSSLAMHCSKQWQSKGKLIYIPSVYGKTLADIFTVILEHIGYEVTSERSSGSETEVTAELGSSMEGGIWLALKASFTSKLSRKRKKSIGEKRTLFVKSPTDNKIFDLCEEHGLLLVLDEMHKADERLKLDMSAFLKAYSNKNCKSFKICILGTEKDASKLVIRDPGVDRVLQEVDLKPITRTESDYILSDGMKRLGITFSEACREKLIKCAVGSPFVLQYLCLEIAEKCARENRSEFENNDIKYALHQYASAKAQRVLAQYKKAIETIGSKRYRKQILHAMAHMDDDYVTMDQLVAGVSTQLGDPTPSTALSGPLRDLKSETYGCVLTDVEGISPSERAYNYSAFTDPATKSIIRLVEEIQQFADVAPPELLVELPLAG